MNFLELNVVYVIERKMVKERKNAFFCLPPTPLKLS